MSDSNNTSPNSSVDSQAYEAAILKRASSGISSVSVDGMSTSFQSVDQQLKALSALKRLEASKNPLGAMRIFKVTNQEH